MNEYELYSGGCVCGAIRYRVLGPPAMVTYCHCDDCRKNSGSIVSVLAGFQQAGFELERGNPTSFEATPTVKRSFCKSCGTPLKVEE